MTKNTIKILDPWWITGITDSEGCFSVYIKKPENLKSSHKITLEFKITQKEHSEKILYEILSFFGVGSVVIDNRRTNTKKYHVTSIKYIIETIVPHFNKYPCLTSKFLNFKDWAKIAELVSNKEHLKPEGIQMILDLANSMNTKRTFEDKFNYCNSTLNIKKRNNLVISESQISPNWVRAFLDGEGTLYNYIFQEELSVFSKKSKKMICDSSLEVAQNSHDIGILLALQNFFNSGYIKPKYEFNNLFECQNSRSVSRYINRDTEKIIKFLDEFPLLTRKKLDYLD